MRNQQRLIRSSQFAAVFSAGKGWANDLLVLKAVPNELDFNRFGLIVSKKVDQRAVIRNRVRRRLREVVRLTPVSSGRDIVIIARKGAADASYNNIETALISLLNRAGLLDK